MFGPSVDGFKKLEVDGENTLMCPIRRGRLSDFNLTDNMRTHLLKIVACLQFPVACSIVFPPTSLYHLFIPYFECPLPLTAANM